MWTGIDIGSHSIKVVQIDRSFTGDISIVGAGRQILTGESQSAGTLESSLNPDTRALWDILKSGILPRQCVVGIGGRELNLRTTLVAPVKNREKLNKVMDFEVSELTGKSGELFYHDFAPLTFRRKTYAEIPVLVGLAKKAWIDTRISLLENMGVSVADVYPEPLALYYGISIFLPEEWRGQNILAMDIGANNVNVVIIGEGNLIFARNIAGGGTEFTKSLMNTLNISWEQAEVLKRTEVNLVMAHRDRTNPINASALQAVGQIHSIFQSSLTFSRTQLKSDELEIDRVLISGGGSRIKGLAEHLTNILAKPVEVFNPFKQLKLDGLPETARQKLLEEPSDMLIAFGLAVSQKVSHRSRCPISLLPSARKRKKAFFLETIYYLIAIGLFALSGLLLLGSTWREKSRINDELNRLKPKQEELRGLNERYTNAQKNKKEAETEYWTWLKEVENGSFFANTFVVVNQLLPPAVRVSEMSLGRFVQDTTLRRTRFETDAIVIKGYLTDASGLGQLTQFYHELNNNTIYPLGIVPGTEQVQEIEGNSPKGKYRFEVVIKSKKYE